MRINIISEKNTDGFLMGHVNDYVKEIDDIASNASKRIEQDIQGWNTEAQILDEDKD